MDETLAKIIREKKANNTWKATEENIALLNRYTPTSGQSRYSRPVTDEDVQQFLLHLLAQDKTDSTSYGRPRSYCLPNYRYPSGELLRRQVVDELPFTIIISLHTSGSTLGGCREQKQLHHHHFVIWPDEKELHYKELGIHGFDIGCAEAWLQNNSIDYRLRPTYRSACTSNYHEWQHYNFSMYDHLFNPHEYTTLELNTASVNEGTKHGR